MHEAVMVDEVLENLIIDREGTYIDCTFGLGGHSIRILQTLSSGGMLKALDKDPESVKIAENLSSHDKRFSFFNASFGKLSDFVKQESVSGILLDLGISSNQLEDSSRGFSFQKTGPLDMRINQSEGITASQWLSKANKNEIEDVLWKLGEERASRKIAKFICNNREKEPINSTEDLSEIVKRCKSRRGKRHPATNVFRAIRMKINNEIFELKAALESTAKVLKEGGRLIVISFHSIEDRIVKRFLLGKDLENQKELRLVIKKPLRPTKEELKRNPRSRSAILRVAEKVA
ncbi:uncharacterized protein METZ01_LOCUS170385 [marine metagenome]|uniref:Uncharacterized protein n=1 Tax=marine metagenome TaxID=408172 RepID=A0A382BVK7_9ZZZZ